MRILVVDDNEDAADALCTTIRQLGYEADVETSGAAAMERLREQSYAAVLVDLVMPPPSGMDIARWAREGLHLATPVIAVSGRPLTADEAGASGMFADVVIQKPYRMADVKAVLERALGR